MNNIQQLREAVGMTRYELAQRMRVYPSAVFKWEKGRGNPTVDNLVELARIFGCSTDEVLGLKDISA